MKEIYRKPYIFWVIGIFFLYLLFNLFFSGFYNTIPLIVIYAYSLNWIKLGTSLFFTLVIAFLVSSTAVLTYKRYKERKSCKVATLSGVGAVGGILVGVCPLCITGIAPIVLGALGVSFSFAYLPFQGIEVQALLIVILSASLYLISKKS